MLPEFLELFTELSMRVSDFSNLQLQFKLVNAFNSILALIFLIIKPIPTSIVWYGIILKLIHTSTVELLYKEHHRFLEKVPYNWGALIKKFLKLDNTSLVSGNIFQL